MNTPITYYGGKQRLARRIAAMIPPHRIYVEPFFGGGAVFFEKNRSPLEVINDENQVLMTFYDVCQDASLFQQLKEMIHHTLHSESGYGLARTIYFAPRGTYSDIEVAWAVYVVFNGSYSSTPLGGWKWDNLARGAHMGRRMLAKRTSFGEAVYERLKDVQISCRDAKTVIRQRDTPDTLFYLDPPYVHADQKHYDGFGQEDLDELVEMLKTIKGKFILSHNNNTSLLEAAANNGWNVRQFNMPLLAAKLDGERRRKHEYVIYNYTINDIFAIQLDNVTNDGP